jgi:hypothetical protein
VSFAIGQAAYDAVHERLRNDAYDGALEVHDADGAGHVWTVVSDDQSGCAYLLCTKLGGVSDEGGPSLISFKLTS